MRRVGVRYKRTPSDYRPDYYMSRNQATRLVDDCDAQWTDHGRAIRLNKFAMLRPGIKAKSGEVIELAAIKNQHYFFQGGLTRTETQPKPFKIVEPH